MFKSKQKKIENERQAYVNPKNRVYSYSDVTNKRGNSQASDSTRNSKNKISIPQLLIRWVVVSGALAIAISLLISSNEPIIRISADEVPISATSVYSQSAREALDSSMLNRTKLTFDYLGFEVKMREKHPEIASVNTSFALVGSKPVVRLTFYKPVITVKSLGKSWVVDSRGVAIAVAQKNKLPELIDEIGVAKEMGDTVISAADVEFILTLEMVAKREGINIDKYTTPTIPKQLDVRVVGEQYLVKFNLNENPREQAGAWIVARENLKRIGQVPSEYLDLRASEKVFWK